MSRKKKSTPIIQDPYAAREAEKYPNPIPSREYILELLQEAGRPVNMKQITKHLMLSTEEQLEALQRRLRAMERDGQLMRNRRGQFGLISKMDLRKGRIIAHSDGYGFVVLDEGGNDLFLSPTQMRNVFDGDRVLVRVGDVDYRGRQEAIVVEVLERVVQRLVGRLKDERGVMFLLPDNKRIHRDILIPPNEMNGATAGQIVVAELIISAEKSRYPVGRVVEILGEHMAPGMEVDIAIRANDLPHVWSHAVHDEIKNFTKDVAEADKQNRTDLRHIPIVTIDGEDAQDFDDAVYCERLPRGGWKLIVAIADVSHYVKPHTELDASALERGNSVYFPGQVIPMLPEILSNNLCSLKPKIDRLCMVCEATLTAKGVIKKSEFYEAVIHSHARLTYTQVANMLETNTCKEEHAKLLPHLQELYSLFKILLASRHKRGAIDFDFPEPRIVFDKERKIKKIVASSRNDAHRLIEECMLVANVCTANFLDEHGIPGLYRVHEGPSQEKLFDLKTFLKELGLKLGGEAEPTPTDYADLLVQIKDREDAYLIEMILLRSLSQAHYTPNNRGHFGLAYEAYAHFTSPIRRYPDLLVHRAIKHIVQNGNAENFMYSHDKMAELGAHCSMTERRADDATRDAIDWLKCEFMQDKIGQEFDGSISSTTPFGIFVELRDVFVEGLVHVTALRNDYYHYDSVRHLLKGERTGMTYRLRDSIRVRVARVNLEEKKIDFVLAESPKVSVAEKKPKPNRKKKVKAKRKRKG